MRPRAAHLSSEFPGRTCMQVQAPATRLDAAEGGCNQSLESSDLGNAESEHRQHQLRSDHHGDGESERQPDGAYRILILWERCGERKLTAPAPSVEFGALPGYSVAHRERPLSSRVRDQPLRTEEYLI